MKFSCELASKAEVCYRPCMSMSLDQVKAEALALSKEEQNRLIEEILASRGVTDEEASAIDQTLVGRLQGPFRKIDDYDAHVAEENAYFQRKIAALVNENPDG